MDARPEQTDEQLLARVATDREAFAAFYDRHVETVIAFAARRLRDPELAADVVAAVFVEVFAAAGRFQPGRGPAVAWLHGIARNVLEEHRRRGARQAALVSKLAGRALAEPDAYADLESRIDAEAASRRLYDAIQALSRGERRVLELVALDQLTVTEAAAALGIRSGTARVRLARARRRLRGLLDQGEEGSPGRHPPDAAIAPPHHLPDPLEEPR